MRFKAAAVLLLFAQCAAAGPAGKSEYTDLGKACKEFDRGENNARFACGKKDGVELIHEWQDDRESLTFRRGKTEMPVEAMRSMGFSSLGKTVEWRLDQKGHPYALIARLYQDGAGKAGTLYVIRIKKDEVCVVDMIDAGKDKRANENARKSADDFSRPCEGAE